MNTRQLVVALLMLIATAPMALATPIMLDLTTKGSSGFINGAEFLQGTIKPTGTGVYEPFLRLQRNGTEQGFNTSAPGVMDNKAGIWTKDLLAGTIPTITVNGKLYREIRLDINESNSKNAKYLSLDSLEIYLQDTGGISSKAGLTNLRYSMDTPTKDYYVKLDYTLAPGSGWDDMSVLLPEEIFADSATHRYFYLYSQFGLNFTSDAGFEEWAADPLTPSPPVPPQEVVPEPGTFTLLGLGMVALGLYRRTRRT
ncbi:PEP-CTERM sorting domain-containing protein [Geobacter argillaceus]|uniref:Putative secreted protein with PEP-CTERM sorting signal n=1 Tax=Geobacter argillaceus TaxID=345631 RepID=A0A562VLZ4_9BACT|nr:PEP-CTERM sorting domain-containing protein [Geobacter argillaceus]TWJ18784.1 putative secreted protein with PEP-CTERM sorting signal [Geobacter argillaceus]